MHKLHRLLYLSAFLAFPLAAQETRVGEEGFESPPATIADAEWLVGQWSGEGIGGAEAHESWLAPSGDTMVGTFVQETEDGGIMFTEHMYLMELDGSLAVKLKHFNPDLTGWEDKEGVVTFRLLAVEPCALYFQALTYRCVDPGAGPASGLIVAVRMKSGEELRFNFYSARSRRLADKPCADAVGDRAIDSCMAQRFSSIDDLRQTYLDAAISRYADNPELLQSIALGEKQFVTYRTAECAAQSARFGRGSLGAMIETACRIQMTQERIRVIWGNWLIPTPAFDSGLPKPDPAQ
ncbi:DUF6265 family protein [Parerythrobacter aestuarii]|uniref:DUF6265 family protein n=1 Tax=Parerythrobacter aestuarii TaxID=3020909 RepID=UPI0024DEE5F8|nr:DUF6265 family protein [Parerythrobacter aestuarii]